MAASAAPLWTPGPERVAQANLTRFAAMAAARYGAPSGGFAALYDWSVRRPEQFWQAMWEFGGIVSSRPPEVTVRGLNRMPGAKWFPGARLNYAENLLRRSDDHPALIAWNEQGRQRTVSYRRLNGQSARLAARLREWGIQPGDRVAGYLPNIPETVIAMLAATSIGAAWTSCSPDFGTQGVLDRIGQVSPRVLFAASSYIYGGKRHDYLNKVRQVTSAVGSIEHTVIAPYLEPAPLEAGEIAWDDCLPADAPPHYEQLPFDHPAFILYSSGTTGKPKCIVHGAGGTLLQHLKEHQLHTDLTADSVMVYFTTCGWMMWNWLVSGLATGATLVLYDGSPVEPRPDVLWEVAEQAGVTIFGTSAKYIAAIEKAGVQPGATRDVSRLRTILSTGSPLSPESFDYVYRSIASDVCLSSISGGTDIVSCFVLGNPVGPVWHGELQTAGLGMRVEIFDPAGAPIESGKGELVCTLPFPSMPVGFWDDPGGTRYRHAYFERFPGVWHHGDYAERTPHGGFIIHGRSDAVLNPGGVRIGTAEIYRIVEQFPEVAEAIAVGQEWEGDVRVILFVKMRGTQDLTDELIAAIRRRIREQASPRHVPAKVIPVADIPRTVSGKITEIAVREVIHGRPVNNTEALANAQALELYKDLDALKS